MSETNALHSLYGGKVARKALAGTVGGQKREQTVLTPEWLLDAIRAVAPIGLDPCTTPENPCKAREFFTQGYNAFTVHWWPVVRADECAYVNPPYGELAKWMKRCHVEAAVEGLKAFGLFPFRPQRRWFVEYTRGYTVASLAPFPFVGHKSAFPAPLCLVCYNLPVPNLGKYLTGIWRNE